MTGQAMLLWTVFLVLGVAAILGECRRPAPHPGVSVHLSHRDRKMNVQYFNDLRRDVGAADMNELIWDLSIAKEARRLGRSCDFDEDPYSEYSSAFYKQLFDPTARPGEIIMNAIRFWAGEKSNFTHYGWQSCRERNTCNYIKMITANTEKAACSLTRCSSMRNQREDEEASLYFVTCLFSPRSQKTVEPFSTGRKCSRCPLYSGCRRGLCSLTGRRYKNAIRPPQNKNRILPLHGNYDSSKGRILNEHRYLDASGNIRIRTQPKYLAQKGRRPSYIYGPPATRERQQSRKQDAGTRTAAVRGIPPQSARVKRQATSYDYRYQQMLRRREEQRRREEERNRRERENRERWVAQQLRQRGEETRSSGDLERRHLEEQRRRAEQLRRQREEEIRQQRELRQRRIEEEQRRRERQRELARQGRRRQVYGPARLESPAMNNTEKFQLTQVHNTLRGTQLAELSWSGHLERWARYIIRCEIEYPGPIDTFTNFGKIDTTSYVYNVVYDWGAEGSDIAQRLNKGCRTPSDRESCNHNVIIRNPFIRSFACATLDCGRKTQLTCIYK